MKKFGRKLIAWYLRGLVRAVLIRFRPTVVAVAGSLGKTRAKDAIGNLLSSEFTVRLNPRSFNTDIGLPLAVLNLGSGDGNFLKWLVILIQGTIRAATTIQFPSLLVLELGTGAPGDMDYLLSMVKPDVLLVTNVEPSHLGDFEDVEQAAQEIEKAVRKLSKKGFLILNYDDPWVMHMSRHAKCPIITYGKKPGALVRAVEVKKSGNFQKVRVKYRYDNRTHIHWYKIKGGTDQHIYALLAAIAVGIHFKIRLSEAADML